ncbi:MAG: hypothetical protein KC656_31760, partial [Myxococcales bacterium]|nr:hypothetical protein [Myxococcales bacterium]
MSALLPYLVLVSMPARAACIEQEWSGTNGTDVSPPWGSTRDSVVTVPGGLGPVRGVRVRVRVDTNNLEDVDLWLV